MTDDAASRAATLAHLHRATRAKGDPVPPPIIPAAIYELAAVSTGLREYGRFDNATWEATEALLGHLENADAIAFPSGMAAISAAMMAVLRTGDRVLLPSDGYYTTRLFAERFLKPLGIEADQRPTASFDDGGFAGYRLVFLETPSNPSLDICDIAGVARAAHAAGAVVVADNTTMTPLGQRPLDLGADIVVAADTKAPNGHSDALFGHVATRDADLLARVKDWRSLSGAIPGPFDAWLVHRGLETLEVRYDRMCSSAQVIAERLADHRRVKAVAYSGLPQHPAHNLARRQMDRFGFLVGLTLESVEAADRFIEGCELIQPATSFGGVHTSAERRARRGDAVPEGFVRLSVGCEPAEHLWDAISRSLEA